jgi:hypothetical protein
MGNNCALLVADLFLYCYERDFIWSLSENTQQKVYKHLITLQDTLMTFLV